LASPGGFSFRLFSSPGPVSISQRVCVCKLLGNGKAMCVGPFIVCCFGFEVYAIFLLKACLFAHLPLGGHQFKLGSGHVSSRFHYLLRLFSK